MRKHVTLTKRIGQTPLEAIQEWKVAHPRYKDVPASYAGRLDPMASGKLLILLGDECKQQKKYTDLDKAYEIEVLLDVGSDTGDILGIVSANPNETVVPRCTLKKILLAELGAHEVPYPVYSSKTVNGKPLFLYALEDTLDTIEVPTHTERIDSLRIRGLTIVSSEELKKRITSLLALAPTSDEPSKALGADFRIAAVKKSWNETFETKRTYLVLSLKVSCGSGTYMRSLANRIGKRLGTRALALAIRRTHIGSTFRL